MGDSGNNAEFATHTVPDNQTDSMTNLFATGWDVKDGGDVVVILFLYSSLLVFSLFEKTMMYVTS
jgi:hypothetical protein